MVEQVRAVYTGLLTYDMHYSALVSSDFWVFRLSCGWSAREVTTPETQ